MWGLLEKGVRKVGSKALDKGIYHYFLSQFSIDHDVFFIDGHNVKLRSRNIRCKGQHRWTGSKYFCPWVSGRKVGIGKAGRAVRLAASTHFRVAWNRVSIVGLLSCV